MEGRGFQSSNVCDFLKGHLKLKVSTNSFADFVFIFLDFICVTLAHEKFRALYNYSPSRIFRSKSRMQNGRVSRTGDGRVKNFVTRVGWASHLKKQYFLWESLFETYFR